MISFKQFLESLEDAAETAVAPAAYSSPYPTFPQGEEKKKIKRKKLKEMDALGNRFGHVFNAVAPPPLKKKKKK